MVKDIKYVIKRILIGVGIALVLGYLKCGLILGVQAMQVSSYSMGTNYYGVNNMSTRIDHSIEGNPWANYANMSGYVNFNFSVMKVSGNSTAPLVQPRGVSVMTGPNAFICNFGSVSSNNSTFNSQVYSVRCPVSMSSSGLNSLTIVFQDFQANDISEYRVTLTSGMSFEIVENGNVNVNVDTSGTTTAINNQITNDNNNTQSIINNQNSNKQDIINNQNQNTQSIINNQNSNTESTNNTIKEQFEVCESGDLSLDYSSGIETGGLASNGGITSATDRKVSDFILLEKNTTYTIEKVGNGLNNNYLCLFNDNKIASSCPVKFTRSGTSYTFNTGNNPYMRTTLQDGTTIIVKGMGEICYNRLDKTNDNLNNINNTINNDNVDSQQASDFFSNFQTDSHGLSGIITSPLRLIQSLSSSQCSPLVLPLPFVNQSATIPCMSTVYERFPTFYSLWQLISTGLIAYYILINLFGKVHSLQNPQDDRIEVLNL